MSLSAFRYLQINDFALISTFWSINLLSLFFVFFVYHPVEVFDKRVTKKERLEKEKEGRVRGEKEREDVGGGGGGIWSCHVTFEYKSEWTLSPRHHRPVVEALKHRYVKSFIFIFIVEVFLSLGFVFWKNFLATTLF